MNKLTLQFDTEAYENEYSKQYIPSQLRVHKIDTFVTVGLSSLYAIYEMLHYDYISLSVNLILIMLKLGQHIYICRFRQQYVGFSLSVSNFTIALLDVMVFIPQKTSPMQIYFQSMTVTIYHICLLISSNFLLNLLTCVLIVASKIVILTFQGFVFETLGVLGSAILFVSILHERTREQKLHFVSIVQENISDEIIQNQLNDCIVLINFDDECNGFKLYKTNNITERIFGLNNSQNLVKLLREIHINELKINLELYLYKSMQRSSNDCQQTVECSYKNEFFSLTTRYYHLTDKRFILIFQRRTNQTRQEFLESQNHKLLYLLRFLTYRYFKYLNKSSQNSTLHLGVYYSTQAQRIKTLRMTNNFINVSIDIFKNVNESKLKIFRLCDLIQTLKINFSSKRTFISFSKFKYDQRLQQKKFLVLHVIISLVFLLINSHFQLIDIKFSRMEDPNVMNIEIGIRQRFSYLSTVEYFKERISNEDFYNQIDFTRNLEQIVSKIGPIRKINIDGLKYSFLIYINLKKILQN